MDNSLRRNSSNKLKSMNSNELLTNSNNINDDQNKNDRIKIKNKLTKMSKKNMLNIKAHAEDKSKLLEILSI